MLCAMVYWFGKYKHEIAGENNAGHKSKQKQNDRHSIE